MGIKTTIAGLTYNASHFPNAAKAGIDVNTLHQEVLLLCAELTIKMKRFANDPTLSMPWESTVADLGNPPDIAKYVHKSSGVP